MQISADLTALATSQPTVVVASDKYKGTLASIEVSSALRTGMLRVLPRATVRVIPLADGGDGSLSVACSSGWERVDIVVANSAQINTPTHLALDGDRAMIEVAQICGLGDRQPSSTEAMHATSVGVGQAMLAALDLGVRHITLACGGSATTDGGAGLLVGLGARITDLAGAPLAPHPAGLRNAHSVDVSNLDERIWNTEIVVASDVDNPLLGQQGSAAVYGQQKGAQPNDISIMEDALSNWVRLAVEALHRSGHPTPSAVHQLPGAGAAGGIGFGAFLLGATARSGADHFLELVGFEEKLVDADVVVTGEGRLDSQSAHGKGPAVVAARAIAAGVPVQAVVGSCALAPQEWAAMGFRSVHALDRLNPLCADDAELSRSLLHEIGAQLASEFTATDNTTRSII